MIDEISPFLTTFQILQKKWTLEIILELFKGRKRFSDLLEIGESLTSKVLSERIKELYENHIIEKVIINMIPLRFKYQLTDQGIDLRKILFEIALYTCKYYPEKVVKIEGDNVNRIIEYYKQLFQIEIKNKLE